MDRRRFLQRTAYTTAAAYLPESTRTGDNGRIDISLFNSGLSPATGVDTEGHTLVSEFKAGSIDWKAYERLAPNGEWVELAREFSD